MSVQLPSPRPGTALPALGRVGDGTPQPLPGVSVVTCCMNRSENLLHALPTWLAHAQVREVVVVDWSSDEPVGAALSRAGVVDRRIHVVRVVDEPRWVLSFAFNLGFRMARHAAVLKLDADITLQPDFFERNVLREASFVAGDWTVAQAGQEHINGFFYIRLPDLLRVRGFNEYITTYGWDDDDIYSRLRRAGLQRVCVDTQSIYHIPHDDVKRLGSMDDAPRHAIDELHADTRFLILTNRMVANRMPQWNDDCQFAPFEIVSMDDRGAIVRRLADEQPHVVGDAMRRDAQAHAAADILASRVGAQVYRLDKRWLMALLEVKRLDQISAFDIALGADGQVPAQSLRRHSVVVEWPPAPAGARALANLAALARALDTSEFALYVTGASEESCRVAAAATDGRALSLPSPPPTAGLTRLTSAAQPSQVATAARQGAGVLLQWKDASVPSEAASPQRSRGVGAARRRRLYIDVQHGLGNRLRAFASAAAIARRTGRDLVVLWVPDHHCECRFADLFETDIHVIESADALPTHGVRRHTYMELEPGADKSAPIDLEIDEDVLVRSAYTLNHPASRWQDENAELRALRPVAAVVSLVQSVSVRGCIGAHVRMEAGQGLDHHSYDSRENWSQHSHDQIHHWRGKSHYSAFIRRIDSLFEERPDRRLFLATDLPENYEVFRQRYGQRLCWLPRTCYDRSREQLVHALADALLLSRCELLLGSTWSSFSELAMRLSTTYSKIEMSGKDF
jgi:hypothetical protein